MATHVFPGDLVTFELKPLDEGSRLLFRLEIQSGSKIEILQFEAVPRDAMALLSALETLQKRFGWRMPSYRPRRAKPKLSIVKDDDDAS
jgi:hypothetical protein